MTKQVVTPERHVVLQAAHGFLVAIDNHRVPTWRIRMSCPSLRDCLHERSVPTSCGCIPGPSSCPTQVSVDLAVFQHARDAFCASWKSMVRLEVEGWCIVVFNEGVHCMTRTPFPVHQLLQFKSKYLFNCFARTQWKLPWYVWLCFYRALLVVLEEWRNEGETNILQCGNAWPDVTENSCNTSSIWVRWFCHCLSHVLKWCPTHGAPALSFFLECRWIWVEVILMIFYLQTKDHIHGRRCYFPTRWFWAVSLPPVSKWRSCAELHTKMVNIIEIHSSCSDSFDDANDSMILPFYEEPLNLPVVGTW